MQLDIIKKKGKKYTYDEKFVDLCACIILAMRCFTLLTIKDEINIP